MTVITISRQFGSHGDTVAQLLRDRLGYRYFDKNLMLGQAAAVGLAPEKIVDLSDEKHRAKAGGAPLPQLSRAHGGSQRLGGRAEASAQERAQAVQVKQLIRATPAQGNVVVVGRGEQIVLCDLPDVLHMRLMAPPELCIQRHAERAGLTTTREAVLARDRASANFVRQYFNADVADLMLYDLIINTSRLAPSATSGRAPPTPSTSQCSSLGSSPTRR